MNIENGIGTRPTDKVYSQKTNPIPSSSADLTTIKYYTGIGGAIMPIDVMKVLPNQTVKMDLTPVINLRNPYRENFKGGFRSYYHVYYMKSRNIWERFQDYISRGEKGNVVVEIPKYYPVRYEGTHAEAVTDNLTDKTKWVTSLSPLAPSDFMGVPCTHYSAKVKKGTTYEPRNNIYSFKGSYLKKPSDDTTQGDAVYERALVVKASKMELNALPFGMYIRVCRDFYFNKMLLNNNHYWYPENPNDFILPWDCTKDTIEGYESNNYVNFYNRNRPLIPSEKLSTTQNTGWQKVDDIDDSHVPVSQATEPFQGPIMNKLYFRQWKGDMFTSGSIYADLMASTSIPTLEDSRLDFSESAMATAENPINVQVGTADSMGYFTGQSSMKTVSALEHGKAVSNVTMQALASLEAWTRFRNRLARVTDNNFYNGVIKSAFGVDPNDEDRTPTYIGGGYIDIGTTTVFNTGGQKNVNGTEMYLGEAGATGSGSGNISIPKFFCKDHGYIMVVQTIVPQVNYIGGLERMWTERTQNEEYYPDLNSLAPQGTLNKELFYTGNPHDNDLFNYVPRYEHYKHRTNKVGGFAQFEEAFLSDASKFMKRNYGKYDELNFNNRTNTITPDAFDMLPFASTKEAPFECECGIHVDAVLPMPYEVLPTESL